MAIWQELVSETAPKVEPKYEVVERSGEERELITRAALARVGGNEEKAALLLKKTLMLAHGGPIWGRSLFVDEKAKMWPAEEVIGVMGQAYVMSAKEFGQRLVNIAFAGMLCFQYDMSLYVKLTTDLGGSEALLQLQNKLKAIAAETFMFVQNGSQYYEEMAGRSMWSWDGKLLFDRWEHLRQFKTLMMSKARRYADITGVALQVTSANQEIRGVEEVILAQCAGPKEREIMQGLLNAIV